MIDLNNFSSFFVANWKLNGNFKFIDQFMDGLKLSDDKSKCIVICPTSVHLDYMSQKNNQFFLGAQNVSEHEEGAYTGEISCSSLAEIKINFCIVGHSERRQTYKESEIDVSLKSATLIKYEIIPIICVGETLIQKENGKTKDVLAKQLDCISVIDESNSNNTIIAYEPIWAIGTGLTPTLEEINNTHQFIKKHKKKFNNYKVLYGGSVNAKNAKEIISLSNVNGALIGGASLKLDEFSKIIEY